MLTSGLDKVTAVMRTLEEAGVELPPGRAYDLAMKLALEGKPKS